MDKRKKDSMFDNNIAYEDIQEDYSVQGGAPQIAQYYRAYKTKMEALALGCLAMHARKRIASLFNLEDVRFNHANKFSPEELFEIGKSLKKAWKKSFWKKILMNGFHT